MEIKFTPWRMHYIQGTDKQHETCVLCDLHESQPSEDRKNLVLFRGETCYVVLNLFPYNTGHLMVVPYTHTADIVGLEEVIAQELFALTRACVANLRTAYNPHGFNTGMNLGRIAGAGIDEHLHMHILPRWSGDSNFMPLIGGTKLVPESLEDTYDKLYPLFQQG